MIPLMCWLPTRTRLTGKRYKIGPIIASMLAALHGRTHSGMVINDEHRRSAFVCHSFVSALVGRVKQKFAPRGVLLAAHKRPPCDSRSEEHTSELQSQFHLV